MQFKSGVAMATAMLDAMGSSRRSFKPKTAYRMPSQSVASKELHLDRAAEKRARKAAAIKARTDV